MLKIQPLARMGCFDFTPTDSSFEMIIGGNNRAPPGGLAGPADKAKQATG